MFGRMMIEPVVQVDPGADLQSAMAALVKLAEHVEIVRWIEFPASVLLFLLVPETPILVRSMYWTARKEPVRRGLRGRTIRRVQHKPA